MPVDERIIAKQLSELQEAFDAHHRAYVRDFNAFKISLLDCQKNLNNLKRHRELYEAQPESETKESIKTESEAPNQVQTQVEMQQHSVNSNCASIKDSAELLCESKKQKLEQQNDTITNAASKQCETHIQTQNKEERQNFKQNQHEQFSNAMLQLTKTDWPIFPYENGKMFKCFCGWKPLTWSRLATRQCMTRSSWLSIPRVQFKMQQDNVHEEHVTDARLCMKCSIECIGCKGVLLLRDSLKYGLCVQCNNLKTDS